MATHTERDIEKEALLRMASLYEPLEKAACDLSDILMGGIGRSEEPQSILSRAQMRDAALISALVQMNKCLYELDKIRKTRAG